MSSRRTFIPAKRLAKSAASRLPVSMNTMLVSAPASSTLNPGSLAKRLAKLPGFKVDEAGAETNMVFIDTGKRDAADLAKRLAGMNVRLLDTGPHTLRAVTNLTVSGEEIGQAIGAFEQLT